MYPPQEIKPCHGSWLIPCRGGISGVPSDFYENTWRTTSSSSDLLDVVFQCDLWPFDDTYRSKSSIKENILCKELVPGMLSKSSPGNVSTCWVGKEVIFSKSSYFYGTSNPQWPQCDPFSFHPSLVGKKKAAKKSDWNSAINWVCSPFPRIVTAMSIIFLSFGDFLHLAVAVYWEGFD